MNPFKFVSTAIAVITGGLIGLQSTVSSTARAEVDIVHIRDTVTNYEVLIDKRIVTETDTLVRVVNNTVFEKDYLWASKALKIKEPTIVAPTFVSPPDTANQIASIGVPIE